MHASFFGVGIYSSGTEARKGHSGEFEEAYLGDIADEVTSDELTDRFENRYDRPVTIHTTVGE